MADARIKEFWSNEVDALLEIYKQFQVLLPAENRAGALHVGEDGRYVEHLLKEYLKRYEGEVYEVLPTEEEIYIDVMQKMERNICMT